MDKHHSTQHAYNFKDLTGQSFGRLTVISEFEPGQHKTATWRCVCSCGNVVQVLGSALRVKTKSCGCLKRDKFIERVTKHGLSGTPEYVVWMGMWSRCTNPGMDPSGNYAARKPPERWRDFSVFYADMGPRPSSEHTLERVDNSEPYGPTNCVWATRAQQSRNTSRNRWVCLDGVRLCVRDACRLTGLDERKICARLQNGWTAERASDGRFTSVSDSPITEAA